MYTTYYIRRTTQTTSHARRLARVWRHRTTFPRTRTVRAGAELLESEVGTYAFHARVINAGGEDADEKTRVQ